MKPLSFSFSQLGSLSRPHSLLGFHFPFLTLLPFLFAVLLSTFLTNPTVYSFYSCCICFTLDLFTSFLSLTCCLILSTTHYCLQFSLALFLRLSTNGIFFHFIPLLKHLITSQLSMLPSPSLHFGLLFSLLTTAAVKLSTHRHSQTVRQTEAGTWRWWQLKGKGMESMNCCWGPHTSN